MKIHIGNEQTKTTLCGKAVVRRWWVSDVTEQHGRLAGLMVYRVINPKDHATCPECLKHSPK